MLLLQSLYVCNHIQNINHPEDVETMFGNIVHLKSDLEGEFAEELEQLLEVIQMKNDHIEELQEALKESVTIISEREEDLFQEQIKRKDIQDQVFCIIVTISTYILLF